MNVKEILLFDPSDERQVLDFRPLGIQMIPVLGRYNYNSAHPPLEPHNHGNCFEVSYVERGQQSYVVEGKAFSLDGGNVFVTFPNEVHSTDGMPEGKGVVYWMVVRVPSNNERLLSLSAQESALMIDRLMQLPHRQFQGSKVLEKTLQRIFVAYDNDHDPLRVIRIRNLLIRFLLELLDSASQSMQPTKVLTEGLQAFIAANLEEPVSVRDMAKYFGLSESRFKSRFKEESGFSPADFALRMKVAMAKQLLAKDELNVTEVAMRLGFSTSQYFATVFKRYTGQSPSEFRN